MDSYPNHTLTQFPQARAQIFKTTDHKDSSIGRSRVSNQKQMKLISPEAYQLSKISKNNNI